MKQIGRVMNRVAVLALALAVTLVANTGQAQSTKQGKAQVRAIHGSARYSTGGGAWMELKTGATLTSGMIVSTAAGSHVDLFLGINGPVVRVAEDTTMGIDKLTYTDTGADAVIETQLNLTKGTLIGSVRKLAQASRYEIKTPAGVAGIRGTDYVITHTLILHILRGLGHVAYILPDGNILSESVSTGEMFVPPGKKQKITKDEHDKWSKQIPPLSDSLAPRKVEEKVFNDPRIGDRETTPVDTEGSNQL